MTVTGRPQLPITFGGDGGPDDHAPLSPSKAGVWVPGPGSLQMCRSVSTLLREPGEDHSGLGTAAHWHGGRAVWFALHGLPGPRIGDKSPAGVMIDDEMLECITLWATDVRQQVARLNIDPDGPFMSQERIVRCSAIHPECWGRPDLWMFDPVTGTLVIYDYNHGFVLVEAYENWQTIIYAAGIVDHLARHGYVTNRVEIRIVQPRTYQSIGPINVWTTTIEELDPLWMTAKRSADIAMSDKPVCSTGSHCSGCDCRHDCSLNRRTALSIVEYTSHPVPQDLTGNALSAEWALLHDAYDFLKDRLSSVEAKIKSEAMRGRSFAELRVEPGPGSVTWDVPAEQVAAVGQMCNVNVTKPIAVLTPKQAAEVGYPESLINAWSSKKPGKLSIKRITKKAIRKLMSTIPERDHYHV